MRCGYLACFNRIYLLIPIIHLFNERYALEFLNYWLEAIIKIGQADVLLAGVKCSLEFFRFYNEIVFEAFSQEFIHHVYFQFVGFLLERVHNWYEGSPFYGNYVSQFLEMFLATHYVLFAGKINSKIEVALSDLKCGDEIFVCEIRVYS